jgi:adenylate cyclase
MQPPAEGADVADILSQGIWRLVLFEYQPRANLAVGALTPIRCARDANEDGGHKMSATQIVPRWEWRCFAPSLASIAQAASIPTDAAPHESDEIYLLASNEKLNANLRDGVLDIKRLRQTSNAGLQLWEPVFKARFPLSSSDLASAAAVWALSLGKLTRESYDLQQFIDEVISTQSQLRVARVHKSRRGFSFGGCIAELARLTAESQKLESFSLEHENPQRVLAALRTLGLDGRGNTNYPLGLKRALGLAHQTAQNGERGISMASEIEHKYLVDTGLFRPAVSGILYRQGYLSSAKEHVVRVRIAGEKGFLTVKGLTTGVSRLEFEYQIPLVEASIMLDQLCERPLIEKTRYRVPFAGRTWEVDVFHGDNDGLVIAEVEVADTADQVTPPPWAAVEVSDDPRYFNNNLAANPYKNWTKSRS